MDAPFIAFYSELVAKITQQQHSIVLSRIKVSRSIRPEYINGFESYNNVRLLFLNCRVSKGT